MTTSKPDSLSQALSQIALSTAQYEVADAVEHKPMDNDKLFQSISKSTKYYADKATELSERLRELEVYLANLPGKTQVTAKHENYYVRFSRAQGSWALHYKRLTDATWSLASKATVETKAIIATVAPTILAQIAKRQDDISSSIDEGLSALSSILDSNEED